MTSTNFKTAFSESIKRTIGILPVVLTYTVISLLTVPPTVARAENLTAEILPGQLDLSLYPNIQFRMTVTREDGTSVDPNLLEVSVSERYESVSGPINNWINVSEFPATERPVDVVFCLDHSGSMVEEINAVKDNVNQFVETLSLAGMSPRLGLVTFQDNPVTWNSTDLPDTQLTEDPEEFKRWVRSLSIAGGMEHSFEAVFQALSYNLRPEAQKVVILVTDEPPLTHFVEDKGIAKGLTAAQDILLRQNALLLWWGQDKPFERLNGVYLGNGDFAVVMMQTITRYIVDHFVIAGDSTMPADGTRRIVTVNAQVGQDSASASFTYRAPLASSVEPPPDPECADGDVNEDGAFNMADVQLTLDLATGKRPAGPYSFCKADRNSDGLITPYDAEKLVRLLQ